MVKSAARKEDAPPVLLINNNLIQFLQQYDDWIYFPYLFNYLFKSPLVDVIQSEDVIK